MQRTDKPERLKKRICFITPPAIGESHMILPKLLTVAATATAYALHCSVVVAEDRSFGELKLEQRARQPAIAVPETEEPPVIDGKIGYKEWFDAGVQRAFIDQRAGVQHNLRTALYLKYDREALYVGVLIERPRFAQDPKADFEKGKHKHIWWRDDNFEIFLIPGEREEHAKHSYVFVGNSKGAYAELVKPLGSNPAIEWEGKWEYAARRSVRGGRDDHWPCWEGELKIPYSQFVECQKPQPGVTWEVAFMNQQLTPVRKIVTWSQAWSFKSKGYSSLTMGRLRFVGKRFYVKQKRVGRTTTSKDEQQFAGNELMLYSAHDQPVKVTINTALYRSEHKRPDSKAAFLDLWDMVRHMDQTGEKMMQDPKMAIQAFRSRSDLVTELNDRYRLVRTADTPRTLPAKGVGYYLFKEPMSHGEYLLMTDICDSDTGDLLYSYILPFAYFPGFNIRAIPYYLRHQKIRAELDLSSFDDSIAQDTIEATLSDEAGQVLDRVRVRDLSVYEKANAYLNTSRVPEGATLTVRAALIGPSGKVKHQEQLDVLRPSNPEWFGNQIGKSKVICEPFQPLKKRSDDTIELYERTYRLGSSGLPESIVSRGTELLARPISLTVKTEREIKPDAFRLAPGEFSGRDGKWESIGTGGRLQARIGTTLAYDGMLRYDVSLEPRDGPVTVEHFSLHVPVKKAWSRYFGHHATGTRLDSHSKACKGGRIERWFEEYRDGMPFTFAFLLCAEDRGIQWFCASDRHWSNRDERKKIAVRADTESNTLVVSFIDRPKTVSERTDYRFGLTVTPVRPCDPDHPCELISGGGPKSLVEPRSEKDLELTHRILKTEQELGVVGVGDYLNQQLFGVPRFFDEKQEQKWAKAIDSIHQRGLKVVPYANWGVNSNLPFFKAFGHEMLREPFRDISYSCFLQLMASPFPDWYLHTLKHSRETLGIDGNYMDGTQYPRLCSNELEGMGWTDEQGRKHGTYDVWAQREFAERLYVFWHHDVEPHGIIGSHSSQIPLYFLAPFTDYTVSGEYHLAGKTLDEQCPLDTFLMFYCGWPHGVTTQRLWWNWYKKPLLRNQVWTMNMLHDVLMRTGGGNLHHYRNVVGYGKQAKPYVRIRHVRRLFDDSKFMPYWSQQIVKFNPEGPKASVWISEARKAAFVFVANIPNAKYVGAMSIDTDALPAGAKLEAYDAMLDREMGSAQQPIRLEIKPMRYRMVTVGLRTPLPDGARIVDDDEASPWSVKPTKRPKPTHIGTYALPREALETDGSTLLLANFDGSVDAAGSRGLTKGRMRGESTFVEGRFGQAFRCESDTDDIVSYDLGSLLPGEAGTLEFWFKYLRPKPPAKPARFPKLLGLKKSNSEAFLMNFYRTEEYDAYMVQPHFFLKDQPDKTTYASLTKAHLQFDQWNHVGITWQGKTVRVFANGKVIKEMVLKQDAACYFGPCLTVGSAYSGGGAVDCLFDDLRLSDVVRY